MNIAPGYLVPKYVEQGLYAVGGKLHRTSAKLEERINSRITPLLTVSVLLLRATVSFFAVPLLAIENVALGAINLVGLALGKERSFENLKACTKNGAFFCVVFYFRIVHMGFAFLYGAMVYASNNHEEAAAREDREFYKVAAQRKHGIDKIVAFERSVFCDRLVPEDRMSDLYRLISMQSPEELTAQMNPRLAARGSTFRF